MIEPFDVICRYFRLVFPIVHKHLLNEGFAIKIMCEKTVVKLHLINLQKLQHFAITKQK